MAKKQIEIFLKPSAERQITAIAIYIEEKGYPFTAEICRSLILAKRSYRCAIFQKKYIFVYKLIKQQLVIFKVIHSSRLK